MVIVPLAMWSQPPSFTFSQAAGGPGPAAQNLAILATGPPVSFTLTTDVSWLSTVPASGETSANIAVTANGHGLAPGIYHGNVTASGPGATPLIVPVTLTIEPENFLTLEPHDFDFFYWPGIGFVDQVNSADMNVTGSRTLKWTAVKSPDDWFYFANYTTNGATPYRFVIGIAWASLNNSGPVPIGTFSGAITITSPEATNSPQIATLHGYSLPAAPLSISKTSVSFQSQQADPPPSIVSVSALSPTMFTVSVPRPNSWLSVSQSADATPATVTFTVKTSSLPAGSYSETVALYVQQNDGPPIPMHINVTLFVAR
jgi:hypothetical protein